MVARILPPEEWHRLTEGETAPLIPILRPDMDDVLVVEDADGRIVRSWAVIETLNLHGAWAHPAVIGHTQSIFAMLREMKALAREKGHRRVQTGALTNEIAELCEALKGEELPGRHFVLNVET